MYSYLLKKSLREQDNNTYVKQKVKYNVNSAFTENANILCTKHVLHSKHAAILFANDSLSVKEGI